MTPILVTTIALALHVLVLLPLAASWRLPEAGRVIGLLYMAAVAGLGLYHTGIFNRGSLAPSDIPIPVMAVGRDDSGCTQFLDSLKSAGVDLTASDALQRLEAIPGWDRIPEEGREFARDCIRGAAAAD